jgi:hypothetical protein
MKVNRNLPGPAAVRFLEKSDNRPADFRFDLARGSQGFAVVCLSRPTHRQSPSLPRTFTVQVRPSFGDTPQSSDGAADSTIGAHRLTAISVFTIEIGVGYSKEGAPR